MIEAENGEPYRVTLPIEAMLQFIDHVNIGVETALVRLLAKRAEEGTRQ